MNDLIHFSYNDKSSVLLIFFFNAVVFFFLLLVKGISENRADSKWLALFVGLCGLYICPFMLGYAGWYSIKSYREFLFFIPFQQLFLIGPVLYFYIQSLLNPDFEVSKRDYLHFTPAVLYLLYSLVIFITDKWILDDFYFYADGRDKDLDFWYQMSGLISMLMYLFLGLRYYRNYRNIIEQEVSFADEISFKWIERFMIAFGIILLLRVLFFILNPEWGEFGSKYWYYLCFSILFFYIAMSGYFVIVKTTTNLSFHQNLKRLPEINTYTVPRKSDELAADIVKEWKGKILMLFSDEKIYTHPNLTITHIAEMLETHRNLISSVINQGFEMNFNDFVNEKRTEAVIQKLKQREHTIKTLLSIALDSGFNSKATFNRAFKKHTGLTPRQYIAANDLK